MAQYDRTDLPDENNSSFYVDDFGEQMRNDEALPERGEGTTPAPADESLAADDTIAPDNNAFYEQAPGTLLDDSYHSQPTDSEIGYSPAAAEEDDYDPLRFRRDEEDAL